MRNFINIVESTMRKSNKVASKPTIDMKALSEEVKNIALKLKEEPFGIVFDRKIADAVIEAFMEYKTEQDAANKEEENFEPVSVQDALDHILYRNRFSRFLTFSQVRKDVDEDIESYQDRAAERHGFEDGDGNYIESSQYLIGMEAQKKCAVSMDHFINTIYNPESIQQIVVFIKDFMQVFEENQHVRDDGEQPTMSGEFYHALASLMPILILIVTTKNT